MTKLSGRIALVTGASSGIGHAVATRLAADGAIVVTVSRSQAAIAGTDWRHCDVADAGQVDAAVAAVVAAHGSLDIVVNNAGVQLEKSIADTTDEDFDRVMNVNVRGVFNVARAAVRAMRDGTGGSIINVGSTAAQHADHGLAIYNASKGAVHSLTRAIAIDHGADGIRCNAVAPGWIATAMADAAFDAMEDPEGARRSAIERHPVGRLGRPEDVAAMVSWLASDEAGYATGSIFTLDGGLNAQSPIGPA